jgi:hypothetical protein
MGACPFWVRFHEISLNQPMVKNLYPRLTPLHGSTGKNLLGFFLFSQNIGNRLFITNL